MKECSSEGCCNPRIKQNRTTPFGKPIYNSRCRDCKLVYEKYGITIPERNAMYVEQNGECLICGIAVKFKQHKDLKENEARACVDHCHKTGEVRGILCHSCNGGLGMFKDNLKSLEGAIMYLKGV